MLAWIFSASLLKQQSAGKHVAPLGHIILIPSQPVFVLFHESSSKFLIKVFFDRCHYQKSFKNFTKKTWSKKTLIVTTGVIEDLIEIMVEVRSVIWNIKSKEYFDRDKRRDAI
jgi:hypothetical protein